MLNSSPFFFFFSPFLCDKLSLFVFFSSVAHLLDVFPPLLWYVTGVFTSFLYWFYSLTFAFARSLAISSALFILFASWPLPFPYSYSLFYFMLSFLSTLCSLSCAPLALRSFSDPFFLSFIIFLPQAATHSLFMLLLHSKQPLSSFSYLPDGPFSFLCHIFPLYTWCLFHAQSHALIFFHTQSHVLFLPHA